MNRFRELDERFLLSLERIAHWTQCRFAERNIDAFSLAWVALRCGFVLFWLILSLKLTYGAMEDGDVTLSHHGFWMLLLIFGTICSVILLPVYGLYDWLFRKDITQARAIAYLAVETGSRNPLQYLDFWRRMGWWIACLISVPLQSNFVLAAFGAVVTITFIATTPLHPNEVAKKRAEHEAAHLVPSQLRA